MTFEHAWALGTAGVVPLLLALFVWADRKRAARLARFASGDALSRLLPVGVDRRRWLRRTLFLLAVVILVFAAAGPKPDVSGAEQAPGLAVLIALDVSRSMNVNDLGNSRLDRAREAIDRLLAGIEHGEVGLIVFAGESYLQCPLTLDHQVVRMLAAAADTESLPAQGTSLAGAIELAVETLKERPAGPKEVVLLSDGESTEGDWKEAVKRARRENIRIHALGFGTPEGGPIPVSSDEAQPVEFRRDAEGNPITSRLDEAALNVIARASAGRYWRATKDPAAFDELLAAWIASPEARDSRRASGGGAVPYLLMLAIALLVVEGVLAERPAGFRSPIQGLRLLRAAAVLLALGSSSAFAQVAAWQVREGNRAYRDGDYREAERRYARALRSDSTAWQPWFDLGGAYFRQGRFQEALDAFVAAATLPAAGAPKADIYYNMGGALFKLERLEDALEAYKQALRFNPNHDDARHNLAVVRRLLRQAPPRQEPPQSSPDASEPQRQPSTEESMTADAWQQLLDQLGEEETAVQRRVRSNNRRSGEKGSKEKDW